MRLFLVYEAKNLKYRRRMVDLRKRRDFHTLSTFVFVFVFLFWSELSSIAPKVSVHLKKKLQIPQCPDVSPSQR
jgi:hypothetical protein